MCHHVHVPVTETGALTQLQTSCDSVLYPERVCTVQHGVGQATFAIKNKCLEREENSELTSFGRPPFVWCLDKEAAWPTKLPRQLAFNKTLMTGLQRDRIAENHKNMLNITLRVAS